MQPVGFVNNFCYSLKDTFSCSKEDGCVKTALKISLAALTVLAIGFLIHLVVAIKRTYCIKQTDSTTTPPNNPPLGGLHRSLSQLEGGVSSLESLTHTNVATMNRLIRTQANDNLRLTIVNAAFNAVRDLPQPITNPAIEQQVQSIDAEERRRILNGTIPTGFNPELFEALRYVEAGERSVFALKEEIFPNIYIGDYSALQQLVSDNVSNPRKITRVISATRLDPNSNEYQATIPLWVNRCAIEVNDDDTAWPILEGKFDELFTMIDEARLSNEPMLIHCSQGVSRSVTILIAYLINRCNVTADEALLFIKTKRFVAEPVPGLMDRVRGYAASLGVT